MCRCSASLFITYWYIVGNLAVVQVVHETAHHVLPNFSCTAVNLERSSMHPRQVTSTKKRSQLPPLAFTFDTVTDQATASNGAGRCVVRARRGVLSLRCDASKAAENEAHFAQQSASRHFSQRVAAPFGFRLCASGQWHKCAMTVVLTSIEQRNYSEVGEPKPFLAKRV